MRPTAALIPKRRPWAPTPGSSRSTAPRWACRTGETPDYFIPGRPYLDGVDLFVISEYAQQVNQFKAGRIHALSPQAQDFQDILRAAPRVQVIENDIPNAIAGIAFGHLEPLSPAAKDDRVRKAVSLAVDRDGLIETLSNAAIWKAAGKSIQWRHNNYIPAALKKWWIDPR
jgi:ABC-type transport system substrate-binding protein